MRRKNVYPMLLVLILILFPPALGLPAGSSPIDVVPPYLEIGTFYSGQEIKLRGSILPDRDIIIEIRGPDERSIFNMKGRVGPFWMNREKVQLEHAPFLYMLILPKGKKWANRLSSLGIGIAKLKQGIVVKHDRLSSKMILDRFVELKRSEQLYGEMEEAIVYSGVREGRKYFETRFYFPSSTIPGEYKIMANVVHDGKIEETSVYAFGVRQVGFIKEVHELAYHRVLIYGILCVVIALFVGAIIGLFFKRTGAH